MKDKQKVNKFYEEIIMVILKAAKLGHKNEGGLSTEQITNLTNQARKAYAKLIR